MEGRARGRGACAFVVRCCWSWLALAVQLLLRCCRASPGPPTRARRAWVQRGSSARTRGAGAGAKKGRGTPLRRRRVGGGGWEGPFSRGQKTRPMAWRAGRKRDKIRDTEGGQFSAAVRSSWGGPHRRMAVTRDIEAASRAAACMLACLPPPTHRPTGRPCGAGSFTTRIVRRR